MRERADMAEDNVAAEALAAERLNLAIRLRVRGAHWNEIADKCGYASPAAALRAVGAAMANATMRADETADMARDVTTLRLEYLLGETLTMLDAEAPETYDADGNPLGSDDRAVKLRAVDEARRIVGDLAKIKGVAAPPKDAGSGEDGGIRIIGVAVEDII